MNVETIPPNWLRVEWTRPLRTCSECGSEKNATGWRKNQDRHYFLCEQCGPQQMQPARAPVPPAGPVMALKRRGRPPGSRNKRK